MSMPEILLVVMAVLFGLYGWLSGLELGVSLMRLSRSLDGARNQRLFTPVWELTNMILVFGFVAFSVFFNNAVPRLTAAVFNTLAFTMVVLLTRACVVLYMYYIRSGAGFRFANVLFLLCSAAVPMGFAAIGIYALTGQLFWQTQAGVTLFVLAGLGLAALATSFVLFQTKRPSNSLRLAATSLTVLWAAVGTLGLQHVLPEHLLGSGFVAWTALLDVVLLYIAVLLLLHREQRLWIGVSVVTLLTPAIWALSNLPYLVFPGSLAAAYGAQAYASVALIGLLTVAPLMILGAVLFVKLYTTQPSTPEQLK